MNSNALYIIIAIIISIIAQATNTNLVSNTTFLLLLLLALGAYGQNPNNQGCCNQNTCCNGMYYNQRSFI